MKSKTKRTIQAWGLLVIGAIVTFISGNMAGNYSVGEAPAMVSVTGFIGLTTFIVGLVAVFLCITWEE